jgi:hypothetical protein
MAFYFTAWHIPDLMSLQVGVNNTGCSHGEHL